jgi:hypothetical protein
MHLKNWHYWQRSIKQKLRVNPIPQKARKRVC